MRIVLVGEANPYGSDPTMALYPMPENSAGQRLCCNILGMWRRVYLQTFERVNLCPSVWSIREARTNAAKLLMGGGKFMLFGSKVCSGFGVPFIPFTIKDDVLLRLPHPSGRNLIWNDETAIPRVRRIVAEFVPEVADLLGKTDHLK